MAYGNHNHAAFATFLILCRMSSQTSIPHFAHGDTLWLTRSPATSFFLGILFSLFPYDYPILWTSTSSPPESFVTLENHLLFLYNSPPIITRILHIVIGTGLLGFLIKLYRPSESNKLFDGASLMLYMCGVIIYVANIVKGMRVIASGDYGAELVEGELAVGVTGVEAGMETPLGRDDSLQVMAASNTILALVLVGVLVLQAGQWYAERKDEQEMEKARTEKAASHEGRDGGNKHRSPTGSKKKN